MRNLRYGYLMFTITLYWYFMQFVLAETLKCISYESTLGYIITQIITLGTNVTGEDTYLNILSGG